MKIKSFLAKPYAAIVHSRVRKEMLTATTDQQAVFQYLIRDGKKTIFGKEHGFDHIKSYEDFKKLAPIRSYESFKTYIDRIKAGDINVLWKGKPIYFAKTSGTTSGVKYIPITSESIPFHINTARNALLCYMAETGNSDFANGRMIFLSGSPEMERVGSIPTGRLSGIVNHFVPGYLRGNQLPTYETNCIEDWEEKLSKIVAETIKENMTLISGIPPWMQMYFDWIQDRSGGKSIKEIFPELQVIVHGGVNFEPYRSKLTATLGGKVDMIETYPASEGFFAYQDTQDAPGLLLNTNAGMFFEFVPVAEIGSEKPTRYCLEEIKTGENYVLIVSSNAGLWAYNTGDTVKFVSANPYRLVVSGRVSHYISAFGEHVIGEEVDGAIMQAAASFNVHIKEFTVAPRINVAGGLPYHEWFVEFDVPPADFQAFSLMVDNNLRKKNIYYDDLIKGRILQPLVLRNMQKNAFIEYMKSQGKLGGQNKVPRLSNNREIADALALRVSA